MSVMEIGINDASSSDRRLGVIVNYLKGTYRFHIAGPFRGYSDMAATDACVLAMYLWGMLNEQDIKVHGKMSHSLAQNLEKYGSYWNMQLPRRYHMIEVTPTEGYGEDHKTIALNGNVLAMSGGIDSLFSLITSDDVTDLLYYVSPKSKQVKESFKLRNVQQIAERFELPLHVINTNVMGQFSLYWGHQHVLVIAAMMHLLRNHIPCGMMACEYIGMLSVPYGTNSFIRLLSSSGMEIKPHGHLDTRFDKIRKVLLAGHGDFVSVCSHPKENELDCGACFKCTELAVIAVLWKLEDRLPTRYKTTWDVEELWKCMTTGLSAVANGRIKTLLHRARQIGKNDSRLIQIIGEISQDIISGSM